MQYSKVINFHYFYIFLKKLVIFVYLYATFCIYFVLIDECKKL